MHEILACPIDKHNPLELIEIDTRADKYTGDIIILEGLLYCNECSRFYPIIDEIPVMLPDDLRDKHRDLEFLQKWQNKIPDVVIKHAKPWHL